MEAERNSFFKASQAEECEYRGDFGTRATASSCPSNPVWFVGASRRMRIT